MSDDATCPRKEDPWGRPPEGLLYALGYPSVWLIFLLFPIIGTLSSQAPLGWRILSLAALTVFAFAYAASWWFTRPIRSLGPTGNTFAWTLLLAALSSATAPAIGLSALGTGPFLVACLAFKLRPKVYVPAVLVLLVIYLGLAVWAGPPLSYWVPPMMLGSTFLMAGISVMIDREDRSRQLTHELELARQRESIGRDVHDLLGHSLTVIAVKTELARKLLDRDPARAAAELDSILDLSREALGEVRATAGQLRTPEWSAQVASSRTALRAAQIDADLPGSAVEIPAEQKPLLAWCLREAVTNVVRHSRASRCVVEAGSGYLTVTDDGRGIPADRGQGNGLRGMKERVEEAGGSLRIGPSPDAHHSPGTRLEITLP